MTVGAVTAPHRRSCVRFAPTFLPHPPNPLSRCGALFVGGGEGRKERNRREENGESEEAGRKWSEGKVGRETGGSER